MAAKRFTRFGFVLLLLAGCAQLRWSGRKMDGTTATPEQVEMDRAQCTAQTYAANVPPSSQLVILTSCMKGKGYLSDAEADQAPVKP